MSRVVHFEIPTQNLADTAAFYSNVFGWSMQPWGDNENYVLVETGPGVEPGINGAILEREGPVVNTVQVRHIDKTAVSITENGGEIVVDKHAIPNVGWLLYAKDPEGNIFGVMEPDSEALP